MGESAAPFGESDTRRSARKKIFELPTGSPSDLFAHISPRLALSKFQLIRWGSNRQITDIESLFFSSDTYRQYTSAQKKR